MSFRTDSTLLIAQNYTIYLSTFFAFLDFVINRLFLRSDYTIRRMVSRAHLYLPIGLADITYRELLEDFSSDIVLSVKDYDTQTHEYRSHFFDTLIKYIINKSAFFTTLRPSDTALQMSCNASSVSN
jgi:hypothetical protein